MTKSRHLLSLVIDPSPDSPIERRSKLDTSRLFPTGVQTVTNSIATPRPVAGTMVEVNGRTYAAPKRPTVVIVIDGFDPAYLEHGLAGTAHCPPCTLLRSTVSWGLPISKWLCPLLVRLGLLIGNPHETVLLKRVHGGQCAVREPVLEISRIKPVDDDHHGRTLRCGISPSIDFDHGARNRTGCRNGVGHGLNSGREAGGIELASPLGSGYPGSDR